MSLTHREKQILALPVESRVLTNLMAQGANLDLHPEYIEIDWGEERIEREPEAEYHIEQQLRGL